MLKDVSNTLQNFKFMGAMGFEIVGGVWQIPLVKCVGTKRLGKGRFKWMISYLPLLTTTTTTSLEKFFTVTFTPSTTPIIKHKRN